MYNKYFGFREKPFKLVPNPDYLFLSKGHEVALAHLNYATDQGDGFVVITGEVGTGKTTLCRNFLERLDDQTDSAYIFNPRLDSVQLLTSICHEYGLKTSNAPTVKELLDQLNQYLIARNMAGRKVVLLIDEAQSLSTECLELVRMISNLETTRSKLLQIILVGQPELGERLETYELRQLAQRISLNCSLYPLTAKETAGYIQHRVNIAAQRHIEIFTPEACRLIHQYAKGIPRLINIACDRVLLAAFSKNLPTANPALTKKVLVELSHPGRTTQKHRFKLIYLWLPVAAAILVVIGLVTHQTGLLNRALSGSAKPGQTHKVATNEANIQAYKIPVPTAVAQPSQPQFNEQTQISAPPGTPAQQPGMTTPSAALIDQTSEALNLDDTLRLLSTGTSRMNALTTMLAQWGQPPPNPAVIPAHTDERSFFQIAARQYGLRAYILEIDWPLVKQLNLPAIVVFLQPDSGKNVYLALVGWQGNRLILADSGHNRTIITNMKAIQTYAQGRVYIFWKNTLGYDAIISQGANAKAVLVVKTLLQQIGYQHLTNSPVFDHMTRVAIMDFQKRHNIQVDGLVGPLTKIFLIREADSFDLPSLNPGRGVGA